MPKNLSFHTFFKKFSKKKSEIVFVNTSNSFGVTDFIQHFFSGIFSGHSLSVYNSQVFTIMAKLRLSRILTCNIKRDLNDCLMKRKLYFGLQNCHWNWATAKISVNSTPLILSPGAKVGIFNEPLHSYCLLFYSWFY